MLRKIIKTIVDTYILVECLCTKQEVHTKKRLLIFRKDVLGDFVIFLPTIKHYREFYKEYEITLVVSDMAYDLKPLFPFIDHSILFEQKKFRTSFWYRRSFIKNLTKKGFDAAVYPVYSSESIGDMIMKATKAKSILDFKNILVEEGLNEMDKNMSFVSKVVGKKCEAIFPTIDAELLESDRYITLSTLYTLKPKEYVVLVPGSSASYKMWPLEKMAAIADYCIEKGYTVILLGSKSEKMLGDRIVKLSKHPQNCINLIGETNLASLVHMVKNAKFYFGNDTGTLHIAASVTTPAIAVMGGGHFKRFFPYGNLHINRIIFDKNMHCKNDAWECAKTVPAGSPSPCIRSIEVEDAIKEIDSLLTTL